MVFTKEQNQYILRLYGETNNRPSKAEELFKEEFGIYITSQTIKTKWRNEGYKPNSRGGANNGLTDNEVSELHIKCEGNMEKMLKDVGRENPQSLVKRCKRLNLKTSNIPKTKKRESEPFTNYIL